MVGALNLAEGLNNIRIIAAFFTKKKKKSG